MLPRRIRHTLTGAIRGRRSRWTSKVVLQVELRSETADPFSILPCPPMPGCKDVQEWRRLDDKRIADSWREEGVFWRDATEADIDAMTAPLLKQKGLL